MLTLSVIGTGYLGAVHAASMASLGYTVIGVDVDTAKISSLAAGHSPFFEPGLDELLARTLPTGRLRFTTDFADAAAADVHFLCLGTPQQRGSHAADLTALWSAVDSLVPHLRPGTTVVGKSTVPVGTAPKVRDRISATGALLAWNPEFLREGHAVGDTLHPDRIVVGVEDPLAEKVLRQVYAAQIDEGIPFLAMDMATAELVKVSANAFLSTKISFINAMSEVCEVAGADVVRLAEAIGYDERIGSHFLRAGLGFGGGCLPKDIRAFMARAGELGVDEALTFLREVDAINMRRRQRAVDDARNLLGGSVLARRIACLGAAFKPNSDDVRDSPALSVAGMLHMQGADVRVHDPKALPNAARLFPTLNLEPDLETALTGAELVMVLTEWDAYRNGDPAAWAQLVDHPLLLDTRNALDPGSWIDAGWDYRALGRPHIS